MTEIAWGQSSQSSIRMRIVNHDEERLTFPHTFKAARHRLKSSDAAGNHLRREAVGDGRAPRRQNVVDIDASRQRRFHRITAAGVLNFKMQPLEPRYDSSAAYGRPVFQTIGEHLRAWFRSN